MSYRRQIVNDGDSYIFLLSHGYFPVLWTPAEGVSFYLPKDEDSVEAAESERIRKCKFDGGRAGGVGDNIQIAGWIGFGEVSGGRQNAILQGEQRRGGFDSAGCAERM